MPTCINTTGSHSITAPFTATFGQDKSNGGTLWQHLRICSKTYRKRYGST
ncbi:IS30 family transposase [Neisseria macacae ATCC 33926]|uniref:IS30 family transposase n=1 Tax=Neisseria macacae ATCC 33926 TaxID=997348 RepID=A0AA36UK68_9NEIS|nr:IS30 family transposase [Neisseria macacae ATCC 33926]